MIELERFYVKNVCLWIGLDPTVTWLSTNQIWSCGYGELRRMTLRSRIASLDLLGCTWILMILTILRISIIFPFGQNHRCRSHSCPCRQQLATHITLQKRCQYSETMHIHALYIYLVPHHMELKMKRFTLDMVSGILYFHLCTWIHLLLTESKKMSI